MVFQRRDHARHISIEPEQPAVLSPDDGVAGAYLRGQRVGLLQPGDDLLLVWHGDTVSAQRYFLSASNQVIQLLCVERKVNRVDRLATERGIHHDRRKRVLHWIAGDSINAS